MIKITLPALDVMSADALFPYTDESSEKPECSEAAIKMGAEKITEYLGGLELDDPAPARIELVGIGEALTAEDKELEVLGLARCGVIEYQMGGVFIQVKFLCQL